MTGTTILRNTGATGTPTLVVEIAWGALPYTDPTGWTWTDITTDVLLDNQVSITKGRSDQASTPQPASCSFTLNNATGKYSQGGQSPNYPNVKRGVPIRVRVIVSSVSHTRFFGYAASFTPGFDVTGTWAQVAVTAAGVKRRLIQQTSPVIAPLTHAIPIVSPAPVAYWPLTEGSTANVGTAAIGSNPMVPTDMGTGVGTIAWAADKAFAGTSQSPILKGGEALVGAVAGTTTAWTVMWAQNIDSSTGAECFFYWGGATFEVITYSDGTLQLLYTPVGSPLGGITVTSSGSVVSPPGQWTWLVLSVVKSGVNIACDMIIDGVYYAGALLNTPFFGLDGITLNSPTGTTGPTGFSQCVVYPTDYGSLPTVITGYGASVAAYTGYAGEYAQDRMIRLASEQGEVFTAASGHRFQRMGAQQAGSYLSLMEACALVDQGVLFDGTDQGLSYISQDEITSVTPTLTIDASSKQLATPPTPVDDDQRTINTYTATRTNGSAITYADTISSQSTSAIGIYDGSSTVDTQFDGQQLLDVAGWKVNLGTVAGYRYPTAELWLHATPSLLANWLAVTLESRLDLANLYGVVPQLSNAAACLLVEGWTEVIDQYQWSAKANCTSYDPWLVGEVSDVTGDSNPFVWRCDTVGSTTVSNISPGASTCQVSSTDLWTTNSDDFPINLNIGGWEIAVTSISGSSSPQTFNLFWYNLPANAIPSGSSVSLWQPTVIDVAAT